MITGAATVFTVSDIAASIAYYRDVLGFTPSFEWGSPLRYAGLCRDQAELHLLSAHVTSRPPGQAGILLFVTEIDTLYAEMVARGAIVVAPLADREYGMRDCGLADPDGNHLTFAMELKK
jgi:catechol 2,3-dioxygenase-like lactoylglutathione lyase family enzyme